MPSALPLDAHKSHRKSQSSPKHLDQQHVAKIPCYYQVAVIRLWCNVRGRIHFHIESSLCPTSWPRELFVSLCQEEPPCHFQKQEHVRSWFGEEPTCSGKETSSDQGCHAFSLGTWVCSTVPITARRTGNTRTIHNQMGKILSCRASKDDDEERLEDYQRWSSRCSCSCSCYRCSCSCYRMLPCWCEAGPCSHFSLQYFWQCTKHQSTRGVPLHRVIKRAGELNPT
jgi:hypothetical protein